MKIVHVVGARPNFVKVAQVHAACVERRIEQVIVHTGQHYDDNMSRVFFQELGLPHPGVNLGVGSGSHSEQVANVMIRIEKVIPEMRPNWVLVYGDVNSTMAAAIACAKLRIPVAHVEAGLRSFDWTMPEEVNRKVTDHVADLLFTPSDDASENLLREGIPPSKIRLVGNVMIDTLVQCLPRAAKLPHSHYPDKYGLVTLHRPSNVDNDEVLLQVLQALAKVREKLPLVFPVHPRTKQRIEKLEGQPALSQIQMLPPLGYLEFLHLEQRATVVITDSGGVQEETTFLGVPCLTLRDNTERPITVHLGTNLLLGSDYGRLIPEVDKILVGKGKQGQIPPLWDGQSGKRIVDELLHIA